MMKKLTRGFYNRDAAEVARDLLGCLLRIRTPGGLKTGRIVETEAYLGSHDLACHSARGRTERTEVMFGPPGFAYVYLVYGMHHCLNVVTGPPGEAAAVLIRALEPLAGIEGRTDGPGRLCRALGIDRSFNGGDLLSAEFHVAREAPGPPFRIRAAPRIGVDYAGAWARRHLRFYMAGNPFVSREVRG